MKLTFKSRVRCFYKENINHIMSCKALVFELVFFDCNISAIAKDLLTSFFDKQNLKKLSEGVLKDGGSEYEIHFYH